MYKGKKFLAIIPARYGSKRLKLKNIKPFDGKPLLHWTLEASLNSKYIDYTIVSSDSQVILETIKNKQVIKQKRDYKLACDESSSYDVVLDSFNYFKSLYTEKIDYIILLQPTSPLRNSIHIDEAIENLFTKKATSIISVCECEHNPLLSNTLSKDCKMIDFLDKNIINKRSQDLETYYRINGAIYIIHNDAFIKEKAFYSKENTYAYVMQQKYSVDIDTILDFKIAEILLKNMKDMYE